MVKNLPGMWETWVWTLGGGDPLEKEMATHSSILARRIPWTEEPGGLQSRRSQRVGHDWATNTHCICYLLSLWSSVKSLWKPLFPSHPGRGTLLGSHDTGYTNRKNKSQVLPTLWSFLRPLSWGHWLEGSGWRGIFIRHDNWIYLCLCFSLFCISLRYMKINVHEITGGTLLTYRYWFHSFGERTEILHFSHPLMLNRCCWAVDHTQEQPKASTQLARACRPLPKST